MFGNKTRVSFTDDDIKILIYALNELRNRLISEERYTDAVAEIMIKLAS